MDRYFSACEIVEMGIQIEKNGADFYNGLADMAKNPEARAVFEHLAQAEERHIEVFQRISSDNCRYEPEGAYPDEYFSYMNALAGQYVFTRKDKGAELARTVKSYEEGIKLGINMEKDSILFYEEMRRIIPDSDRHLIDGLIAEEKKHLRELCELKGGCSDEEGKSL
ncbi:MAG: ferritin family protein [Candidatus Omnitrophota bacterium]